jgi:hypothetical protein
MQSTKPIPNKKLKIKKKSANLEKTEKISPQNLQRNEETVLLTLKSLSEKEQELQEERDQLLSMEEKLKKRIIKEIETKKSSILDLETEIPELKQRIEYLARVLEIPVVK